LLPPAASNCNWASRLGQPNFEPRDAFTVTF
jgi:hypothetical protein